MEPISMQRFTEQAIAAESVSADASSHEPGCEPQCVLDESHDSMWHTPWDWSSPLPQSITLALPESRLICRLTCLPRQDPCPNGYILRYNLLVSEDGDTFGPIASGAWESTADEKEIRFAPVSGRFVRLEVLEGVEGFASAARLQLFEAVDPNAALEKQAEEEPQQIAQIVDLTMEQLRQRYPGNERVRRGVHPKDHGCVMARFTVNPDLPDHLREGVFATPGREYQAWVRFSNASVAILPDSSVTDGHPSHTSRGMAIKLLGVEGEPLLPAFGPMTQDFLMVNHPVFAFANVEDYLALSRVLLEDKDVPNRFFVERIKRNPDHTADMNDPATRRAVRTFGIVSRIQSPALTASPPAYQRPPASPADNQYFSGAPFLFGDGKVMKFSARPLAPHTDTPDLSSPDYLRKALYRRLNGAGAKEIVFEFLLQIRRADELADKVASEIEDACVEWDAVAFPFVPVAKIVIAPQDFERPEQRALCEDLIFTPWHGLQAHRPLGGINRLRLGVYEASSRMRHIPKEPDRF